MDMKGDVGGIVIKSNKLWDVKYFVIGKRHFLSYFVAKYIMEIRS